MTSPFLNGIIFSAGPSGAMHCGPWCCQAVHKLTRKPVASAFPRPFGAVMFTTPRCPVLTPLCVRAPHTSPRTSWCSHPSPCIKYKCQKLFCAKGFFFLFTKTGEIMSYSHTPILILVTDPFQRVFIIYVIEFNWTCILGVLWPQLSPNKGSDTGITSWQWKKLILSLKLPSARKLLNLCGIIIHTPKPTPESLWYRECHSVKKNKICALETIKC